MKSKYTLYIITLLSIIVCYSCVSDPDYPSEMVNAKVPEIKTLQIDKQTATSITISAEVLKNNGMPVIEYGVYWSTTSPIDTTKADHLAVGEGKGEFTATIEGLKDNSEYYVAPYAMNGKGIALGETLKGVTNSGLGSVKTLDPVDVTATTVTIGGKIEVRGEGEIKARGVYQSATADFVDPDTIYYSTMQTDSFVCYVTDLSPNATYYVKAFVVNNFGTFTGTEKSFEMADGRPSITGLTKIEINFYDAIFQAEVISEGSSLINERGFCWKEKNAGIDLPTIDNDTILVDSVGIGTFKGKIEGLSPQKSYHIRAFAKNKFGISYSNDTIFFPKSDFPSVAIDKSVKFGYGTATISASVLDEGQSEVIESGLCWSSTNLTPDTLDNRLILSSGKTNFSGVLENLKGDTRYYVRAYAKNKIKTSYSEVFNFDTPAIYFDLTPLNQEIIQGTARFFYTTTAGFILGGDKGATYTNDLYRYNLAQGTWSSMKAYPEFDIISGQTPVVIDRVAYVFGGKNMRTGDYINELFTYDTYENKWSDLSVSGAPDPIGLSAGCLIGKSAYYIGGIRKDSVCKDVKQFNSLDNNWTTRADIPEAQYGGIAVAVNDVIYAGLGLSYTNENNKKLWKIQKIWQNDPWVTCEPIPDEASKIIGGVVFENNIYVIDNNGQIWKYSTANDTWSKKIHLTVLGNNIHCMYVLDNKIYIGLGSGSSKFVAYNPYWDN
ncbi:hypothetical protein [Massilibacteroides sp.]|uniref:Kelch repeat-containing protein n=1 Tax=Massilibacteroides sp. TaxID=2034766 RepID=UPI002629677B|nr:hypothetical protein [Massilibacteroides sp.]MDD4515073.1 hypothetical protein [Massilibacteroides sp.]